MSLLPYFYDIERPFRLMERELFGPSFYQPRGRVGSLGFPSPSCLQPWGSMFSSGSFFEPLERISEAMSRLALNESTITADDEKFQVNVDVQHFAPEEVDVKVINGQVIVEGKHEERRDQHGYISRRFVRKYALPEGCLPDTVESKLSSDGVLTVTAPKVLALPSTGERIVPIMKTGPVRLQNSPTEFLSVKDQPDQKDESPKSVEEK